MVLLFTMGTLSCHFPPITPKLTFFCSAFGLPDDQAWPVPGSGCLLCTVGQVCEFSGKEKTQSPYKLWHVCRCSFPGQNVCREQRTMRYRSWSCRVFWIGHHKSFYLGSSMSFLLAFTALWKLQLLSSPFSFKLSPTFTVSVAVLPPWLFLLSFFYSNCHQSISMRSVSLFPALASVLSTSVTFSTRHFHIEFSTTPWTRRVWNQIHPSHLLNSLKQFN